MEEANNIKAGFWIRLAATLIDLFSIFFIVKLIVWVFRGFGIYIPFELTFISLFTLYQILFVSIKGYTLGKNLCGLTVQSSSSTYVKYIKIFLRETIYKFVSALFLFLGYIWVGISQRKRAWHDYFSDTEVTQKPRYRTRSLVISWLIVFTVLGLIGLKAYITIGILRDCQKIKPFSDSHILSKNQDYSASVEISTITEHDHIKIVEWLDSHGKDPLVYLLETANKHQVTILGEVHEKKDYLFFLKKAIPELYHKAGVTCIAMEVCLAEDNEKINRLVTAPEFDRKLALEIARHQWWGIWGFKEYWDIFEVVWRLNQEIPNGQKKMRLIGIDVKCYGPSMGLVTGGEGAKIKAPVWEKLRIFRLLNNILPFLKRDELMAINIEKEIIEKGERAIVWIGSNHSYTSYRQPIILNGKIIKKWTRMGVLLNQKYGGKVYQIALHEYYFHPIMRNFVEPIMNKRGNMPVGFDVHNSPFANLRDNTTEEYSLQPNLQFGDKISGYIYLKPWKELQKCEWLHGYVSKEMFIVNKPFYKAWAKLAGKEVRDAEQADEVLAFLMTQP